MLFRGSKIDNQRIMALSPWSCCLPGPASSARARISAEDSTATLLSDEYFASGLRAQEASEWESAIDYFSDSLKYHGDSAQVLFHLGFCYQEISFHMVHDGKDASADDMRKKYLTQALGHYQRAIKLDNKHHGAWYNQGYVRKLFESPLVNDKLSNTKVLEELGSWGEACQSFKQALLIDPNDKDAHINLGNCFMSLEDFEMATKTYRRAIELDPASVMAHYNLGTQCSEPFQLSFLIVVRVYDF